MRSGRCRGAGAPDARYRRLPTTEVSIEESIRERFSINVGDTMRFDVLGRTIDARVTSVRDVEWARQPRRRLHVRLPSRRPRPGAARLHRVLAWAAAIRRRARGCRPSWSPSHPNVSVIDGREILADHQDVVDNVTLAVTVVGALVLLSGVLILIGAVAMTKFQRVYEAAIFKTLGATRRVIASMLLVEYGLLGALAGAIGSLGAVGLTWGISRYALDIPFTPAAAADRGRGGRDGGAGGGGRRRLQLGRAAAQAAGDAARRVDAWGRSSEPGQPPTW